MRVEIAELAGGGRGFGRVDNEVWFVAGALPGEVVEAVVERRRAGIVEARAIAIEHPSPWREAAPCPVASRCGGCDLAHVARGAAAEVLRAVACGALRHAPASLAAAVREAQVHVSPLAYRLRARLHWDLRSGILGFRGPRSHQVAAIDPCRVLSPRALAAVTPLAAALGAAGCGDGEVEWLEDLAGEHAVAGWRGAGAVPPGPIAAIDGWHPVAGLGRVSPGGWGNASVTMALPRPLEVPIGSFVQGNRHLMVPLFGRVVEIARASGAQRAVDLYGGVGFLAAAARVAGIEDVLLVEGNSAAARAARTNLPEVRVLTAAAESFLAAPGPGDGTLAFVDPPRIGMSAQARDFLLAWRPAVVVAFGCDAGQFGHDAGALLGAGYRLDSLELWDLFAGSHHAEVVAVFRA